MLLLPLVTLPSREVDETCCKKLLLFVPDYGFRGGGVQGGFPVHFQ